MISMRFGKISNKERIVITEISERPLEMGTLLFRGLTAPGAIYSKWGGFIDGSPILILSSLRFPREAEHLDPQERLF